MSNVEVTRDALIQAMAQGVNLRQLTTLIEGIADLVVAKNHDYGDAWQRFGIFTPLIRINDKILRVHTLASGEDALVADENIVDTLRDIIGYAALALLRLEHEANTTVKLSDAIAAEIAQADNWVQAMNAWYKAKSNGEVLKFHQLSMFTEEDTNDRKRAE